MELLQLMIGIPLSVVLLIIIYVKVLQRKYRFAESVPFGAISKYPIFIDDYKLLRASEEEQFTLVTDVFAGQDRLFKVWLGPLMAFGTCHPELVQKILTNPDCVEKPFFYRFLRLDLGLFTAKWDIWRRQRKVLNCTFNLRILHSFIPIFERCCRIFVEDLRQFDGEQAFDVVKYTCRCSLAMVFQTSFGVDCLENEESDSLVKHVKRFFTIASSRFFRVHLFCESIYRLTTRYANETKSRKFCQEMAAKIISNAKLQHNASIKTNDDETKKPQIFMNQLLALSDSFSEQEIIHNTFTMIIAGNDTSGELMAYASLFLAMFPHIQDKVYSEISTHFPLEQTQDMTPDQLKRLTYTEMFLNECLRLCPIGPLIVRNNLTPLDLDGITFPAGCIFGMSLFVLHRRKDIWGQDADQFDPDRFTPERSAGRHPYAFLPFSGGSRNCIGWRYAMISMKMMLVFLLREYTLETNIKYEDIRFKLDVTLKLAFQHMVRCKGRKSN